MLYMNSLQDSQLYLPTFMHTLDRAAANQDTIWILGDSD